MDNSIIKLNKRFVRGIFLLIAMAIFLAACGSSETAEVYHREHNGKFFTVDPVNKTITVDGYTCTFDVSGDSGTTHLTVGYPNGSTYYWTFTGAAGYGGWSDDYDPKAYVAGDELWDVLDLDRQVNLGDSGRHIGFGIFLILLGAINTAFPHAMWYLGYGWRYENAEPSDMALFIQRASGIIAIIVGVICLF